MSIGATWRSDPGKANCKFASTVGYLHAVCHNEEEKVEIWIFDWTGKPVKRLCADKGIYTLCIDEEL